MSYKRRPAADYCPRFFPDHHEYLLGLDLDEVLEEHEHAPDGELGFEPYSICLDDEVVGGIGWLRARQISSRQS